MPPKLSKTSKAVKLLRAKFENGEVSGKEHPKTIWESEELFQKHKLDNFRVCYYNMKKQFQPKDPAVDDEQGGEVLRRRCTTDEENGIAKKRRTSYHQTELDREDEEDVDTGDGIELTTGDKTFTPLYLISQWTEPHTTNKRVSAAIVLPSGVAAGSFSLRVVDGGEYLEVSVTWPSELLDIKVMHRKWLTTSNASSMTSYHPKILGFEAALKALRDRNSDVIESIARIPLPFSVQSTIEEKHNWLFRDSNLRTVYVDLKAFVEDYAHKNDEKAFEVI